MRARLLKPGFFTDQKLAKLPHGARLLFAGLWCLADREGRLIDSPRWIGGQVFPHDDETIDREVPVWLAALESSGFILRYAVDRSKFIQVKNFRKHQTVNQREAASEIPAPPEMASCEERERVSAEVQVRGQIQEIPRKEPEIAGSRSNGGLQRISRADVAAALAAAGGGAAPRRNSDWPQHLTPIREALREHAAAIGRERDLAADIDIGRRIAEAAGGNPARAAAYIAKHSLRHFSPRAVRRRPWPRSLGFWVTAVREEAAVNGNSVLRSKPPPWTEAAGQIA